MRRRAFISLLGGGAAALLPLAARTQQPAMALVGLLSGSQLDNRQIGALGQGLKEIGYIEGRSVAIKYRSADGRFDRLPELAAELVADPAAVIVTNAPSAALVAKAATATIPIVFTMGADPIDLGLVSSLNRPGGNVTGVNFLVKTLTAKRLELLRELMPSATVIGFLTNLTNPASDSETKEVQAAARTLGLPPNPERQQRTGHRCGVREPRPTARQCRDRRCRCVLHAPTRPTGRTDSTPRDSRKLPYS